MNDTRDYALLDRVTKQYPGADGLAVSSTSLTLRSGNILALLGPNGAGKTTIVKMLAGLVTPTSGVIRVMGYDMESDRRRGVEQIGAVLEGSRNLYWRLTAIDNLHYFGSLRLVPRKVLRDRIDELLSLVGLSQFQNTEVGKFSRGMQQKLAIVAALLHDPSVLLLDEPTLGLDVQSARQLENSIVDLAKRRGKTILLTTHMIDLAEKVADQIYVIDQGRKIVYQSTGTLLAQYNTRMAISEIQADGAMPESLAISLQDTFPSVSITTNNALTHLTWQSADQAKMIELMTFLNDKGVTILNAGRRRASLEEIFLSITAS